VAPPPTDPACPPAFGRADAINQAATIEAVRTAAATGTTVTLPTPITG
jgi:hypothetical protein